MSMRRENLEEDADAEMDGCDGARVRLRGAEPDLLRGASIVGCDLGGGSGKSSYSSIAMMWLGRLWLPDGA